MVFKRSKLRSERRAFCIHAPSMVLTLILALGLAVACGGAQDAGGGYGGEGGNQSSGGTISSSGQMYPDIKEADLESEGGGVYSLSVTVSSPYDSPERYADGWRVLAPDGTVLGKRELMHDHASEQPFTRTQTGLEIPEGTERITIEGRDQENGYGGKTVTIPVGGG